MAEEKNIQVLVVEDNLVDLEVLERWLVRSHRPAIQYERATSLSAACSRLMEGKHQVILLDLKLPDSEGLATIECITESAPDAAVIVLTQTDDEAMIDQAFMRGVQDYLVKGRFDCEMLIRSIRYAHERKMMSRQVLRSQRMEGIGALACGIAHDINNVLAPVMMAANLLRSEQSAEEITDSVEALESCAHRGADLVKQLLTFGRGQDGHRHPVDLRPLVKEILKISCETFPKNIRLDFDFDRDLWNVTADPTQMHQVLLNLVINSRDAMPDGGLLRIAVRNCRRGQPLVGESIAEQPGEFVCIAVEDTGVGIPPAVRERIFEPFFSTKSTTDGTGLGLSTSLEIVRSHGGIVNLYSESGVGTVFRVYLPAVAPAGSGLVEVAEDFRLKCDLGGRSILVVEDETTIRTMTKNALEMANASVVTACDGEEGLERYAEMADHLVAIVTDIDMPRMNGIEFIRQLRRQGVKLPILVSTGLMFAEKAEMLKNELNVEEVLSKPFTLGDLYQRLERVLPPRLQP